MQAQQDFIPGFFGGRHHQLSALHRQRTGAIDVVVVTAIAEQILGADGQESQIAVALQRAVGVTDVLDTVDADPDLE